MRLKLKLLEENQPPQNKGQPLIKVKAAKNKKSEKMMGYVKSL